MNEMMPTIRVEVEGLRRTVLHALTSSIMVERETIAKMISKELDKLDIQAIILKTIEREAPKVIEDIVKSSVSGAFYAIRDDIDNAVRARLKAPPRKKG